jgi:peptidylprolyl isomerase
MKSHAVAAALLPLVFCAAAADPPPKPPQGSADVLAASTGSDWRPLEPANTLYLELAAGRVVIELAPAFAPEHVGNIKALVKDRYFDGLYVMRSQDNYVVQWGDPDGKRANPRAKQSLPAEYFRASEGLDFTALPDGDVYAPETGFVDGFPAARDAKAGRAWLTHCYGMVGVGRDVPPDTGSGAELYVVSGHAPRHLDRNLAVVGRVIKGMELLSALPRGTGALGFYDKPDQYVPIKSIRLAADVPAGERTALEVLKTGTPTWSAYVAARRTRREPFFVDPAGHIDICNVAVPSRPRKAP